MDIDGFWTIVDSLKDAKDREGMLREKLEELSDEEVSSFQEHFDKLFDQAYDWKLWGAAYLINGGCSDDSFMDFRYGVITRGRDLFERATSDPDSLSELNIDFDKLFDETIAYVAAEVYESRGHDRIPRLESAVGEPKGEEWDFDDESENRKHLPRLTEKYPFE